jgi:hypothetical protein
MYLRLARSEEGYTMIAVVGAISLVSLLVAAALAATRSDLGLVRRDLDDKRAYAAAQAGISDYALHLNDDNGYWKLCAGVPGQPGVDQAVNLQDANPLVTRPVRGATGDERYAIQLLHASNTSLNCNPSNPPFYNMVEQSGTNVGTFRIKSTGYSGKAKQSIVATFKKASFLDFVYFTQFETSDPVTYGYQNPSADLTAANTQCSKFRREGRPRRGSISPSEICDTIVFVDNDDIDGPLHTNDDLCINGGATPNFGRSSADMIEVSSPPRGYYSPTPTSGNGCQGSSVTTPSPGNFTTNAPVLTPPATNADLKTFAGPTYTYTGQTKITLSGTSMTVTKNTGQVVGPISVPSGGVVYVQNDPTTACSTDYSPFNATYPSSSPCGNVIVHSTPNTYSGQLTIAAENDVIIDGSITHTGNGLLGLIANNFVRIKHPCSSGTNQSGSLSSPTIDAAILAIDHSFIVDEYNCGAQLGTLHVNGAIAQKYRGAVGTVGNSGYVKDYNYDDRLRYQEPPHFFDPVQFAWHVQRETLAFP